MTKKKKAKMTRKKTTKKTKKKAGEISRQEVIDEVTELVNELISFAAKRFNDCSVGPGGGLLIFLTAYHNLYLVLINECTDKERVEISRTQMKMLTSIMRDITKDMMKTRKAK